MYISHERRYRPVIQGGFGSKARQTVQMQLPSSCRQQTAVMMQLTTCTTLVGTGSRGVGVFVCVWEGVTHSVEYVECFEPSENCRLWDSPGVNDTESLLLIQQIHSTPTWYMDAFVSYPKPRWSFSTLSLSDICTLISKMHWIKCSIQSASSAPVFVLMLYHAEVITVPCQGSPVNCVSATCQPTVPRCPFVVITYCLQ